MKQQAQQTLWNNFFVMVWWVMTDNKGRKKRGKKREKKKEKKLKKKIAYIVGNDNKHKQG